MNAFCPPTADETQRPQSTSLGERIRRSPLKWGVLVMVAGCAPMGIQDAYVDAVEVGAAPQTRIYTKVAGQPFSLDILAGALKTDGSIVFSVSGSYFSGYSYVDLVDWTKSGGSCGSIGDGNAVGSVSLSAPSGVSAYGGGTSGYYNWSGGEHGRLTFTFTSPKAVGNARVRIYGYGCYSGSCQSDTRCSADAFTIRPASFTLSSTPASGAIQAAGVNYSMSATAVNSSGTTTTAYTKTPTLTASVFTDWTGAAIPGSSFSGSFGAASNGVATNNFAYSDFGQLTIPAGAVTDTTYVSTSGSGDAAGGDCIAGSSSNTLSGSKYGCEIDSAATTSPRFVPDHYEVNHAFTPACGSFTYLGQPFGGVTLTVYAKNSAGNNLTRLTTGAPSKPTFSVAALNGGSALGSNPLTLSTLDWPANGSTGGAYANASNVTTRPSIIPPAAPPDYETFALKTTISDPDGRSITKCNGVAVGATSTCTSPTTILRYGILKLSDGLGTALIPATMQLSAQYWNGTAFVTNASDSCTVVNFNTNTIAGGSYTGSLTGITLKNTSTTLLAGMGGLMVASTGQKTGSAALAIKLGAADNNCVSATSGGGAGLNTLSGYLGGASCAGSYGKDPSAVVTFGTLRSPYVYRTEKY